MRNWYITLGAVIVFIGLLFLIGAVTGVNLGDFICPIALILVGVALIIRTRRISRDTAFTAKLIGDIRRRQGDKVQNEEIWVGIGDVDLFLTDADVPTGETRLRMVGFVGDIDLRIPEDVGLSITSLAFVTEAKMFGEKKSHIATPYEYVSPGYAEAERKIRLETTFFVADMKARRAAPSAPPAVEEATSGTGPDSVP